MEAFIRPLEELSDYQALRGRLKGNRGILQLSGCIDSQKAHVMYAMSRNFRNC